jgi:hypothetical protein
MNRRYLLAVGAVIGTVATVVLSRDPQTAVGGDSPAKAGTPAGPIGRFQIAGIPGHAYVLDTATGQVWERFDTASSGSSSKDFLEPKIKGEAQAPGATAGRPPVVPPHGQTEVPPLLSPAEELAPFARPRIAAENAIPIRPAPARGETGAKLLAARAVLRDHGVEEQCHVFSVGVEVENLSARMAMVHFHPQDLKLTVLDADGKVVEELAPAGDTISRGNKTELGIPTPHDATIPTDGYAGFSTYRGGYGKPNTIHLAAGWHDWSLKKPGTYRLRGTVTVSVRFGKSIEDSMKPEAPEPTRWEKRNPKPLKVKLELAERHFELVGP